MRLTSWLGLLSLVLGCSKSAGRDGGVAAAETSGPVAPATGGAGGTVPGQPGEAGVRTYGCSLAPNYSKYLYVDLALYSTSSGPRVLAYRYERWLQGDVWGSLSTWAWNPIAMDGTMDAEHGLLLDGGLAVVVGAPNLLLSPGLGELRVALFDDSAIVSPARVVWTAPRADAGYSNYLLDFQVVPTPGNPTVFWTEALDTRRGSQAQFAVLSPQGDLREPPRPVALGTAVDRLVQVASLLDGFAVLYTASERPAELLYVSLDRQGEPRHSAVGVGDIAEASVLGRSAPMLVLADQVIVASTRLTGSYDSYDAARAVELIRLDFDGHLVGAPQTLQAAAKDWEYSPATWAVSGANTGLVWSGFDILYTCRSCDPYHPTLKFALLDGNLAVRGDGVEIKATDGGRFQNVQALWRGPNILLTATLDRYSDDYEENDYTIGQPLWCDLP